MEKENKRRNTYLVIGSLRDPKVETYREKNPGTYIELPPVGDDRYAHAITYYSLLEHISLTVVVSELPADVSTAMFLGSVVSSYGAHIVILATPEEGEEYNLHWPLYYTHAIGRLTYVTMKEADSVLPNAASEDNLEGGSKVQAEGKPKRVRKARKIQ